MSQMQCSSQLRKKVGQSITTQKEDSELGVGEVSVEDWHTCLSQIFIICIAKFFGNLSQPPSCSPRNY